MSHPVAEERPVEHGDALNVIRSAIAEGASEYRFGRGDEQFKSRFASRDAGLESVVMIRGLLGASAYGAARVARFARNALD